MKKKMPMKAKPFFVGSILCIFSSKWGHFRAKSFQLLASLAKIVSTGLGSIHFSRKILKISGDADSKWNFLTASKPSKKMVDGIFHRFHPVFSQYPANYLQFSINSSRFHSNSKAQREFLEEICGKNHNGAKQRSRRKFSILYDAVENFRFSKIAIKFYRFSSVTHEKDCWPLDISVGLASGCWRFSSLK
jgi:hypothetical protein